ncbi:MAG: hypothetical protein ACREFO_01915, partial [Acetobacteraceae bacterium]
ECHSMAHVLGCRRSGHAVRPARRLTDLTVDRALSRYLELLRLVAALLVLLAHLSDPGITDERIMVPSEIGYTSVIVFFVLSGYVIS